MQSHICKVYACLTATCHLHFWQTDRDLSHATAVTLGWNRYQNKSQHGKSTLEKKFLPLLLQGFKPLTFQLQVRCYPRTHTQRCTILNISLSPKSVLLQQLVQSISGLTDRLSGVHYCLMTDNLTLSLVKPTRWMSFSMCMLLAFPIIWWVNDTNSPTPFSQTHKMSLIFDVYIQYELVTLCVSVWWFCICMPLLNFNRAKHL